MRACGIAAAAGAVLALGAVRARANGTAPPDSVSFHADADAPGDFAMNATFGYLFSTDTGESWQWTCHEAVISAPFTPIAHRAPSGTFYTTVPLALGNDPEITLWRTEDRGCAWTGVESLRGETVRALAFRPDDDAVVLAAGSRAGGIAAVWSSTDGGVTFGEPLLEVPEHVFTTIHYAPSDGERVYVAALKQTAPQNATVYRSDDGGDTWDAHPFAFVDQPPIRVLAVDPLDADVLWLRNDAAQDRVYLSTDGGIGFSLAHTADFDVLGLALTAGGDTRFLATAEAEGIFRSTASSPAFVRVPGSPAPRCVEAEGQAVYVCANPYQDPFAAGVTFDAGATFDTAMVFQRITGPIAGCAGTSAHVTICEPLWPQVRQNLGLDGSPTPTATPTPPGGDDDDGGGPGCACSVGSGAPRVFPAVAGILLLLAARRRRAAHPRL